MATLESIGQLFMVDAERVADRGVQVAWLDGTLNRLHCVLVGSADYLPAPDPAAGDQATEATRMMITAGIAVDARRTSKLT